MPKPVESQKLFEKKCYCCRLCRKLSEFYLEKYLLENNYDVRAHCFEIHHFLSKSTVATLRQLWEKFGNFLFLHLVTLDHRKEQKIR